MPRVSRALTRIPFARASGPSDVLCLTFNNEGTQLAVGNADGKIRVRAFGRWPATYAPDPLNCLVLQIYRADKPKADPINVTRPPRGAWGHPASGREG